MRLRVFLSDLAQLLTPHLRLTLAVMVGLLIDVIFQTALPLSLKFLIDGAIVPQDRARLGWMVGLLALGLVVAVGTMVWRDYLYARLGSQVLRGVRERLFSHLQSLSMSYFASVRAGDLMARFSTDLSAVENLVVGALPSVFYALSSLLLLGIALFALNVPLALGVMVLAPLSWVGLHWLLPRAAQLSLEARRRDADVLSFVQENIEGQSAIKAMGLERHSIAEAGQRLDRSARAGLQFNFASYLAERVPNIGMLALHVLVLVWGAHLAFSHQITVGTLVAFNAVLLNLGASVATLTSSTNTLLGAAAGLRRIAEVLDQRPAVHDVPNATELPPLEREIRCEHLAFAHRDTRILHDIDLRIAARESVAIVGPSGSGKSTVLNLLARFHDPLHGRITIDGTDLRQCTQASLRTRIGIVQQDTMLFDASLRENIRLGRPDAGDSEVEDATRLAELDDYARQLPNGYDTHVGAGGVRLSGGQRQRVSIARALLRQPDILLLDEATSALDPATERAINATLESLRSRFTMVRVTHRLAEAAACDRIFVLEAGKLAEQGTQTELLAAHGLYARLWRKQQGLSVSDNLEHSAVTAAWLGEWPLFQGADPVLLDEVSREFVTERASPGAEIIREGLAGDRFYILVRGMVSVSRGVDEDALELARLREGDAFGEAALMSEAPRNATVTALTACVLLSLERSRFRRWAQRDPVLRLRLEALAER